MADEGKWFKFAPFGGFRRQDVITYIEALLKEHNEEKEAYRAGTELLRRERDEARERLTAMQSQLEALNKKSRQVPSLQSDMDTLKAHVVQLASEKTHLSETLQKMEGAREADRAALSQMKIMLSERESRLVDLQARLGEYESAHATAADVEKAAREKAVALESEALENTDRSRELISRLWMETKARYTALCQEADEASNAAVRELERARQLLIGAGQMFDDVNSRLEHLPLPEDAEPEPETLHPEPTSLELLLAQQRRAQSEQAADTLFETEPFPEEENP